MEDKKKWLIVAPGEGKWLAPFVPQKNYLFETIPPPQVIQSWHLNKKITSGMRNWITYWKQCNLAWKKKGDGFITIFPQLAAVLSVKKTLSKSQIPIIAWSFNLGKLHGGIKHQLAKFFLPSIDRFIVHSKAEIDHYSKWIGIDRSRFQFIPLQCGAIPILAKEDKQNPFLLAMGSANRDYETLFKVVDKLQITTVVVASAHAIKDLSIPLCVTVQCGLSLEECRVLAQKARLVVVPISNDQTASGQVTVVEAMRMGRPLIATNCIGTEDYIINNHTGILVKPKSVDSLNEAILRLWHDQSAREEIANHAKDYARENFSDEAIGKALGDLLESFS